jgi:transposase
MEETYLDKKNRVRETLKAEMKIDYLQGVQSNVIAKRHNITIKTFYNWMNLSKEEKVEHYKRLLSINEAVAEEIVSDVIQNEIPNGENPIE